MFWPFNIPAKRREAAKQAAARADEVRVQALAASKARTTSAYSPPAQSARLYVSPAPQPTDTTMDTLLTAAVISSVIDSTPSYTPSYDSSPSYDSGSCSSSYDSGSSCSFDSGSSW